MYCFTLVLMLLPIFSFLFTLSSLLEEVNQLVIRLVGLPFTLLSPHTSSSRAIHTTRANDQMLPRGYFTTPVPGTPVLVLVVLGGIPTGTRAVCLVFAKSGPVIWSPRKIAFPVLVVGKAQAWFVVGVRSLRRQDEFQGTTILRSGPQNCGTTNQYSAEQSPKS